MRLTFTEKLMMEENVWIEKWPKKAAQKVHMLWGETPLHLVLKSFRMCVDCVNDVDGSINNLFIALTLAMKSAILVPKIFRETKIRP